MRTCHVLADIVGARRTSTRLWSGHGQALSHGHVCVTAVMWASHTSTVSRRSFMRNLTSADPAHRIRRSRGPLSVSICRSKQSSVPGFLLRRCDGSHFLIVSYAKVFISYIEKCSTGLGLWVKWSG